MRNEQSKLGQALTEVGYSGVVIYTRNATCAPIRAEEGITGILCPPNSITSFRDMPDEEKIGGYPNAEQLSFSEIDPTTLDSEGRCVILEFPAFVLIGTYCPAERDETRTSFRAGFLNVLDARIRNLVALGKRVIWTGDLNISREEIDTAMAEETMRKNNVDNAEWISTPARRMFNQMLVGGKVHGERDEGRERAIMWDITRGFHEGRKGMYTCWETKVNARPGNYGARIDYVVCSHDMKDWWSDSNIQEGLMGSDHCPVYAVTKEYVRVGEEERNILDMMNPADMFEGGVRKKEWAVGHLLPMSGKLIKEFDKRQNIRDMFTRKPSIPKEKSMSRDFAMLGRMNSSPAAAAAAVTLNSSNGNGVSSPSKNTTKAINGKRSAKAELAPPPMKKTKSSSTTAAANDTSKGQQSLKGFFMSKTAPPPSTPEQTIPQIDPASATRSDLDGAVDAPISTSPTKTETTVDDTEFEATEAASSATKQTWGKLFARPVAPKCEHDEPCKTMLTKKPGVNCGRSFWMCNRPLGPSGQKERGTQWRCSTFVWQSDWDSHKEDPE